MIVNRLESLRKVMKEHNVQAVIIPTSDFHDTEYAAAHFQARAHFSGFTGSAGTLVVLMDQAALWTDGRYFIQAARQLKDTGIVLMKSGEEGTPSIPQYLIDNLQAGNTVAFDGRVVSYSQYKDYKKQLEKHDIHVETAFDLPGMAWENRPEIPCTPTFHYPEKYAGKSIAEKLEEVRKAMKEAEAQYHIINKIDEIAWLLNLRADDIPHFPAALSYFILSEEGGTLYISQERLDGESRKILEENNIQIRDYDAVYEDAEKLDGKVLFQPSFLNSRLALSIGQPVEKADPVVLLKAVKNDVEVEGARRAHLKDGTAVVKFWKWLEETLPNEEITEVSAADVLRKFREQQEDFLDISFDTIAAYGPNAAMPHYSPDQENPVKLEEKGFFLVDSGGQYMDGTTDITRTFVLGDLTPEEKEGFTRVLKGHLALANAKFLHGSRGYNLDVLAREPLWEVDLDYNHGTGHGVGALSSVHEAPNGFRWKVVPERDDSCVIEEGMITSNEPGLYMEGQFGIRHENLLVARNGKKTEYGQFMYHEPLTMVPFDVRGLDLKLMEPQEIKWLNEYHQKVFENLKPYLKEDEILWLKEKTKPL